MAIHPQYLKDLLPISIHQRNRYNVRTGYNLSSVRTRTNLFNVSFSPSVIHLWNDLLLAARNADTLDELKNKLNRDKRKVNPLYYIGCRRLAVLHARLRMKCSMLKVVKWS